MKDLNELRNNIDQIDEDIIRLLDQRFNIAKEIGKMKEEAGALVEDNMREQEMQKRRKDLSKEFGIDQDVIDHIFSAIIQESKNIQNNKE